MAVSRAVAHRGGGARRGEHVGRLRSRRALRPDDGRVDAKLSADDVVFLLHDDTVERTSNGHGAASELAYRVIAGFDAGSWFDPSFCGERMPTLAEVADAVRRLGMLVNIEIKPSRGRERSTGERVASAAVELWRGRMPPLLSSFSIDALQAARDVAPELPRGLLVDAVPQDWRQTADRLGCLSIHVADQALDAGIVKALKSAGLHVMAYTVNDLARARTLVAWGVDAICTIGSISSARIRLKTYGPKGALRSRAGSRHDQFARDRF